MKCTVLGSTGYIGKYLANHIEEQGVELYAPRRDEPDWFEKMLSTDLGIVFYCIGLTADFRKFPLQTIDAHICILKDILQYARMDRLIYLSSTRVYEKAVSTNEDACLSVNSQFSSHLYNLSKLMGESLCINSPIPTKVVRLSNVYGPGMKSENFLSSILSEAANHKKVKFLTTANSSKDFISILDAISFLFRIAFHGSHQIYNLASGRNTSNADIAKVFVDANIEVEFALEAKEWQMPEIDNARLINEFGSPVHDLLRDLPELISKHNIKLRSEL